MDNRDRAAIEELFQKLARVESRSAARDPEAEAFIGRQIAAQPGAPYYMAQTIVVQEQALNEAARRIEELEGRGGGQAAGGGFFGGLFGSQQPQRRRNLDARVAQAEPGGPWGGGRGMGGGGFLAGAAQTAMGVAGGVVLGNMLADWLSPDAASAATAVDESELGNSDAADQGDDAGGDFGDFDVGDF